MSFQLVIAEKPSVARSIAAVIGATEKQTGYWQGGGYLVSWCIGHLVSFAEAGQYDEKYCKWKYEDLPILPQPWQFIVPDEKKQQFEVLRALLNRPDVDSVTAATDAGREGELIFRFVYQMAGCTKPVKRLWVSSMEDAAIREGFANLRPDSDYDALYQSALCRAKADWLVGINATRLFSVLYHKTLTVGRVQTPTLKMLVDREAKILRFQKQRFEPARSSIKRNAGAGSAAAYNHDVPNGVLHNRCQSFCAVEPFDGRFYFCCCHITGSICGHGRRLEPIGSSKILSDLHSSQVQRPAQPARVRQFRRYFAKSPTPVQPKTRLLMPSFPSEPVE